MEELDTKLAVYNDPVNFKVKFMAPRFKSVYKGFIIEEKLHKALTFNLKNSFIKADGELIVGNFFYDDKDKSLKIEINNPSEDKDCEIEITVGTNITDLAAIIESNYVINNVAYIKIKDYEEYEGLTTKSNLTTIKYSSIKIDIKADSIEEVVPAINGHTINLKASFIMLDTDADYTIVIKNRIGENLQFEEIQSYISINGDKSDFAEFDLDDNIVSLKIDNCNILKNKRIDILICTKVRNAELIKDNIINQYSISVNDVECDRDDINIQFIKPISVLKNTIESIK